MANHDNNIYISDLNTLIEKSFLATQELYFGHYNKFRFQDEELKNYKISLKLEDEYAKVKDIPLQKNQFERKTDGDKSNGVASDNSNNSSNNTQNSIVPLLETSRALTIVPPPNKIQPQWHAPWELMRVISGHTGWVRCCAIDPSNEWFATGSADRTIMVWDLASGTRKVTLTGHISTVRDIAISKRQPYLFSVAEDKTVKCWDLEMNKVVRHYHGHLSAVYCCSLHPTLDILFTGGRDASVRVWDIRKKTQIHCLTGHKHIVASLLTQTTDPQVISGSMDSTVRLWDLVAGKTSVVLTNHKKAIRSMVMHQSEYSFASASTDNIKKWDLPDGKFMANFSGHKSVVNSLALNQDNVLVSGADNGSMNFWDWKSGHCFQQMQTKVQPGSLENEAGIFRCTFDMTGSRLITCEADKTIKVWKETPDATPETHPGLKWQPSLMQKRW